MGKVPAIVHDGALVTEQGAVYVYLADLFPRPAWRRRSAIRCAARTCAGSSTTARRSSRRWSTASMKREPAPPSTSPYGDYDTMLKTLVDQLAKGPYLLGERFTAADVLWGTALRWTTMFKLVPETPVITGYIERVTSRPAVARAAKIDADLVAARR